MVDDLDDSQVAAACLRWAESAVNLASQSKLRVNVAPIT